ncbi:MAG TPA: beta-galactosidase, partial [Phycisphaerae bacterium]|nr:beta-galactosidase [Phycisphaerae bacterium]
MIRTVIPIILAASAALAAGAQLQIGKDIVTRNDALRATLKLKEALRGAGRLKLTWTDCYGRTVAVVEKDVQVAGDSLAVELPLSRAVAMQNFLAAELTVGDAALRAPKQSFIVTPAETKWDDYQIIMYYAYNTPAQQWALRDVGITAGQIQSDRTQTPDGGKRWWSYNYRCYCDQINHRYFAAYHSPAYNPKHKKQQEAEAAYRRDRTSVEPFKRNPCFHDLEARKAAMARQRRAVQMQMPFKPFLYGTDECGTGNLVEAIDFCFDPRCLAAFRKWLTAEYGSLAAINAEWGTDFKKLADVVPLTTDQMMARAGENFSPWADHRHFMNKVFADVLKEGCDVLKEVDAEAIGGIVGAQMPSAFGGYDYWLLSEALDCIEPYNIGNNREIWRSLAPDKPAITTAFGFGDMEVWRLW